VRKRRLACRQSVNIHLTGHEGLLSPRAEHSAFDPKHAYRQLPARPMDGMYHAILDYDWIKSPLKLNCLSFTRKSDEHAGTFLLFTSDNPGPVLDV